jgi:hypothetical protein
MSISQHEAVGVLRRTIFRPGWRISAAPAPGDGDRVHVGIEIETVDSSFITRGGEYRVPLTERALIRVSASDYESTEALLFRLLGFIRHELTGHEDREFLRTWDPDAERWTAPFHAHVPEGEQAWDRMQALSQPAVTRVSVSESEPWLTGAGCDDYVCWAEDDNKRAARARVVSAGCDNADDRGDCWESGNGRAVRAAGCEEADDAALSECTEQRVRAAGCEDGVNDQDCWENGGRVLVNAGCAQDGEVSCSADIDSRRIFEFPLVNAAAHPVAVAVAGCNECDGGCAAWG